jgi:hypothetical protein
MDVTQRISASFVPILQGEYEVSAITEVTGQADRDIGYPKGDKGLLT